MDTDRIIGTARDTAGRAQQAAGSALGDGGSQVRGAVNQGYGQVQDAAGQASELIHKQPLTAALVALGIGFLLGRLTA